MINKEELKGKEIRTIITDEENEDKLNEAIWLAHLKDCSAGKKYSRFRRQTIHTQRKQALH